MSETTRVSRALRYLDDYSELLNDRGHNTASDEVLRASADIQAYVDQLQEIINTLVED